MLLWPLFKKLPVPALLGLGLLLAAAGLYIKGNVYVSFPWLTPLGLTTRQFASSDFFPLLPNLGYFLVGACLGKTLYPEKLSLFPWVSPQLLPVRFFSFIGRNSLIFYLLHQPILAAAVYLYTLLP